MGRPKPSSPRTCSESPPEEPHASVWGMATILERGLGFGFGCPAGSSVLSLLITLPSGAVTVTVVVSPNAGGVGGGAAAAQPSTNCACRRFAIMLPAWPDPSDVGKRRPTPPVAYETTPFSSADRVKG